MSEDFYKGSYKAMFYSQGKATFATKILHKALERLPNKSKFEFPITLEVGGGEGLHFEYVKSRYSQYYLTDVRKSALCEPAAIAQKSGLLTFSLQNAEALSYADSKIDRVIFACVLHHLCDPEKALTEARRVVKSGGMVSIYLPCDPGFFYRQLRKIFTRSKAKKIGVDYELINVRQHVTHYYRLEKLIKHVFENDKVIKKKFPFRFAPYDFNVFSIIHIIKL